MKAPARITSASGFRILLSFQSIIPQPIDAWGPAFVCGLTVQRLFQDFVIVEGPQPPRDAATP
jgi:hypothetical protein